MPPVTPAKGVLEAARNFAREEFALKHRYQGIAANATERAVRGET
jgi:hypothetical protein